MNRSVFCIILAACMFMVMGCPTYDDLLRTKKLESISVDLSNAKVSFVKGGTFSSEGIVIKGHYSDGTTKVEPLVLASFSGFDSSVVSDAVLITVAYENCTAQYPVAILDAVLESIEIQVKPAKTIYYKGEKLDLKGLVVMGKYSNGTFTDVTNDCIVEGFSADKSGTQLIYVSHPAVSNGTKTFPVLVSDSVLERITVLNLKEVYVVDSAFDYSQLSVTAVYGDGKEVKLSQDQYTLTGFDSSKQTLSQDITVSVNNLKAVFTVKIVGAEWAGIAAVQPEGIVSKPIGSPVDFVIIAKKYSDGTIKRDEIIPPDLYTISPTNLTAGGLQTITVVYNHPEDSDLMLPSYFEPQISFQVYVTTAQLKAITIETVAGFSGYISPTGPDLKDFIVTGVFSDNTKIVLTEYCTVSYDPKPAADAVSAAVKVSYYDSSLHKEFTASIQVPILPPQITGISVAQLPSRFQYLAGETFDFTGLKLKRFYSNGTSDVIDATAVNCTYNPGLTAALTAGTKKITVTHAGHSADVAIAVTAARLDSISLSYVSGKPSYALGLGPNANNFKVAGTYSDASTGSIPVEYCIFTYSTAPSAAGPAAVKASFYDTAQKKTFESAPIEVTITAAVVQSIEIKTYPSKLAYAAGEYFDPAGLQITRRLSNGTTNSKNAGDAGLTYNPALDYPLTANIKEITVTCDSYSVKIPVTVTPARLKSISLAYTGGYTSGNQPSYPLGTGPYASHFKVTGTYTDNTGKDITQYCLLSYIANPGTQGTAQVQASCYDSVNKVWLYSAPLDVTITAAEVTGISCITGGMVKTTYKAGEKFNPAGLVVKKTLTTGAIVDADNSELHYTPALNDALTVNHRNVTVTHIASGKAADIPVTVTAAHLDSISLTYAGGYTESSPPSYLEGNAPSPSDFTVTGVYADGNRPLIGCSFSYDTVPAAAGQPANVTASYTDPVQNNRVFTSNKLPVNIIAAEITSVTCVTGTAKTAYAVGESLNPAGLIFYEVFSDGKIKTVVETASDASSSSYFTYDISGPFSSAESSKTITVSLKTNPSVQCSFTVTVASARLNSISLAYAAGNQPSYPLGTAPAAADFVVTGVYTDGSRSLAGCTFSYKTMPVAAGSAVVIASYIENGTVFSADITVGIKAAEVTGIQRITMPKKTVYEAGESFNPDGLVAIKKFTDGAVAEVLYTELNFTPTMLADNTTEVTAAYQGNYSMNISIPVTVLVVQSINIDASRVQTDYIETDLFNPAGLVVTKQLSNGSTEDITVEDTDHSAGGRLQYSFRDENGIDISDFSSAAAGKVMVTVTYAGRTAEFEVTVETGTP